MTVTLARALHGLMPALALIVANAAAQPLPQQAPDRHVGTMVCGSSSCHGAGEPWRNSSVLQNEHVTWSQQDKHARAYRALLGERGQRIARNLGIGPAQEAAVCLDCHADFPAADRRGPQLQLSDGVGCEACHGAAERWLGVHSTGSANSRDSLAVGRYPTEDPVARARLCLSCHLGDRTKSVTHRIMGAGHPRLAFELDTFTAIEPAHYRVDDDYARRKPKAIDGVQVWAVGQAVALSQQMAMLADPERNRDGLFPELTLFDCYACHHRLGTRRWESRASTGLRPGIPRLADSGLIMLRVLAGSVAPPLAAELRERGLALHRATTVSMAATVTAARAVKEVADRLAAAFAGHRFEPGDLRELLRGVIDEGLLSGEYADYAAAEQATMATGAMIAAVRRLGVVGTSELDAMDAVQRKLFDLTAKDEQYRVEPFRAALAELRALVPPAARAAENRGAARR